MQNAMKNEKTPSTPKAGAPLLAEGFRNVDSQSRDEQARCLQCLSFIKSHPGFLRVRDAAFERLNLTPGPLDVYDIGCGAGFDSIEIARRLSAGSVCGVDVSSSLINQATARAAESQLSVPVRFTVADARSLTASGALAQASADRVYMERALQHIARADLPEVLHQFHALLRPGGLFVSVEPNWELFAVRSRDTEFTHRLCSHWVSRFNHSDVAMNLPPAMRDAGFSGVASELIPVEFSRFEDADLVYDFSRTGAELVASGAAPSQRAAEWLAELRSAGQDFYCCLMMAITCGRRG